MWRSAARRSSLIRRLLSSSSSKPPAVVRRRGPASCTSAATAFSINSYRSLEESLRGEPDSTVALAKWKDLSRLHDRNATLYYRHHIRHITAKVGAAVIRAAVAEDLAEGCDDVGPKELASMPQSEMVDYVARSHARPARVKLKAHVASGQCGPV